MRRVGLALVLLCLLGPVGCGSYALRGKVVAAEHSEVLVVDRDDPRLDQPGLPGATVSAMLDPTRVNREPLGRAETDPDGNFVLPVDKLGAGMLQYEIMVAARGVERRPVEQLMAMPGGDKRLLIRLARGEDRYRPTYSDAIDDAMREAQPYLRE